MVIVVIESHLIVDQRIQKQKAKSLFSNDVEVGITLDNSVISSF